MPVLPIFVALVALSAVYDVLTLAWHRSRESGAMGRTVALSCALEAAAAIPLVVAFELGTWWPIAAGVVGSAIGTAWGMRRAPERPVTEQMRTYLSLERLTMRLDDANDPRADEVRDLMDPIWRSLSDEERSFLNGRTCVDR